MFRIVFDIVLFCGIFGIILVTKDMDVNEHDRLSNIEFIYDIQLLVESSLLDDPVDPYSYLMTTVW